MIKTNQEHYEYFLEFHKGDSAKSVGWANYTDQILRFDIFRDFIVPRYSNFNIDILDVGCGLAELDIYLWENFISHTYTGIDVVREMIDGAVKLSSKHANLIHRDLMDYTGKSDHIFCSGAFNLRVPYDSSDQYDYLRERIQKMVHLSNKSVCFNLLRYRKSNEDSENELFYYKPSDVCDLLDDMNLKYSIRADYMLNDFTVFIIV